MTARLFPYGVILVLIGIIMLQRSCLKCAPCPSVKSDTVYVKSRDTIIEHVPIPYEVIKEGKPILITVRDTEFVTQLEHVDTAAILSDYFASRNYSDTGITKYGNIVVRNTVTQNKLLNQSIITNFAVPEVHSVTTLPPKFQLFGGFAIGSNGFTLAAGPDLMAKTKRDAIYGLSIQYVPGLPSNQFLFSLRTDWKIHL
jgi:hypothetical protein